MPGEEQSNNIRARLGFRKAPAPPPAVAPPAGNTPPPVNREEKAVVEPPKAPQSTFEQLTPQVIKLIKVLTADAQVSLQENLEESAAADATQRGKKVEDFVRSRIDARRRSGDSSYILSPLDLNKLVESVVAEVVGFGPMDFLLKDDSVSEVMVNGPKLIYYERGGRLNLSPYVFDDNEHVMRIIERILSPIGRRVDTSQPLEDARLPDGSRVNVIIPPLAIDGPSITIRKFGKKRITGDDYVRFGSMDERMHIFLQSAVKAKLNVVISGGTGSGKTTLLNLCSSYIPEDERIVTIEDAAELRLVQEHKVRLEARRPNVEGKGEITIRDLVKNSLRMRPDRIVIGECRSGEALDMLQAMNTGHDGSLTTLHANTPRDAISRMETLCLMSGIDLPQRAIREQIVKAIDVIVQISRLRDGSRKITYITELMGTMEGDTPVTQDIFLYEQHGYDDAGKSIGEFTVKAPRPRCFNKFEEQGVKLPEDFMFSKG